MSNRKGCVRLKTPEARAAFPDLCKYESKRYDIIFRNATESDSLAFPDAAISFLHASHAFLSASFAF